MEVEHTEGGLVAFSQTVPLRDRRPTTVCADVPFVSLRIQRDGCFCGIKRQLPATTVRRQQPVSQTDFGEMPL